MFPDLEVEALLGNLICVKDDRQAHADTVLHVLKLTYAHDILRPGTSLTDVGGMQTAEF